VSARSRRKKGILWDSKRGGRLGTDLFRKKKFHKKKKMSTNIRIKKVGGGGALRRPTFLPRRNRKKAFLLGEIPRGTGGKTRCGPNFGAEGKKKEVFHKKRTDSGQPPRRVQSRAYAEKGRCTRGEHSSLPERPNWEQQSHAQDCLEKRLRVISQEGENVTIGSLKIKSQNFHLVGEKSCPINVISTTPRGCSFRENVCMRGKESAHKT